MEEPFEQKVGMARGEGQEQDCPEQKKDLPQGPQEEHSGAEDNSKLDPADFECTLCLKLLVRPTTTPCGHSFCKNCLERCLEHRAKCPICRACLHASPGRLAVSTDLNRLLETAFPQEYAKRLHEAEDEAAELKRQKLLSKEPEESTLPCFVLTSILPRQRIHLHIFEPRYRLMTRRCLDGSRRFGLVPRTNPVCGTEVEIVEAEELPGGRYYLEVVGLRVFHILNGWNSDGYLSARVRFVDPDAAAQDENASEVTLQQHQLAVEAAEAVEELCDAWQQLVLQSNYMSHEQSLRLYRDLGPMPPRDRPGEKALWIAALLNPVYNSRNFAPNIRIEILSATTAMERLKVVKGALDSSLDNMSPTWRNTLSKSMKSLIRRLLLFTVRHSWLIVLGWVLRGFAAKME